MRGMYGARHTRMQHHRHRELRSPPEQARDLERGHVLLAIPDARGDAKSPSRSEVMHRSEAVDRLSAQDRLSVLFKVDSALWCIFKEIQMSVQEICYPLCHLVLVACALGALDEDREVSISRSCARPTQ
jgi:hypothetical protein